MDEITPLHVTNHYRRNSNQYDKIRTNLSNAQKTFMSSPRSDQIRMLQKSHSFAVISVQTPVAIHEQAFTDVWQNVDEGTPPEHNIGEALTSVNYRNNKEEYIRHSLNHGNLWDRVADMLESGDVDEAHKFILDEMKGVGPAKAPFVLAMLGFEEKMCIDANVISAMGLDEHVSTVVVEKYDAICDKLRDKMPTLKSLTTPFMWQWIVFDWQRDEISHHETFFNVVL